MRTLMLLLMLASPVVAQKVAVIDATDSPPGTYFYSVVVTTADVTVAPMAQVVRPADPGSPPVPKPPTGDLGLTDFVKTEADKITTDDDDFARAAIAAACQAIADKIESGDIKDGATAGEAANKAVDFAISFAPKDNAKWKAFWETVRGKLNVLIADGKIKTVDDVQEAYAEIAAGLLEGRAIPPAVWAMIFKMLMAFLEKFLGGL